MTHFYALQLSLLICLLEIQKSFKDNNKVSMNVVVFFHQKLTEKPPVLQGLYKKVLETARVTRFGTFDHQTTIVQAVQIEIYYGTFHLRYDITPYQVL